MFFYFSQLSKSFHNLLVVFSNSVSRVLCENGHNFFIGPKLSEFKGFEKKLVLKSYDPVHFLKEKYFLPKDFFLSQTESYVPNISENQLQSSKNPELAGERVKKPTDVKSFWVALHMLVVQILTITDLSCQPI